MKKLTIKKIVSACNGEFMGDSSLLNHEIVGITNDSRKVEKDFLYVPIKGERFDGHDFIKSSYDNGAICVLSENKLDDNKCYIKVDDSFQAFKDIAEYYRGLFDVKVIAITGSVGKTTTKEMIYSVLSQKYNVLKTQGNFNNEIGLPLTLFNLEEEHDIAVVEMGMNDFGEISRLSKIARPDMCVITNIGYSHVGHLKSREGIFKAKSEIFDYQKSGGTAYLNGDDDMLYSLKEKRDNIVYFGFDEQNNVNCDITKQGYDGTDFKLSLVDEKVDVHINKPGRYLVYAAMVAATIGHDLGVDDAGIKAGIKEFAPVAKRMDIIEIGDIAIINDVYNASPESVKSAIDILCYSDGRKVCILGDMFELGDYAPKLHHEVGEYAAKKGIDLVICAGGMAEFISKGCIQNGGTSVWFEDQQCMITGLPELIKDGDAILVKASRGMAFEKTVEALKTRN